MNTISLDNKYIAGTYGRLDIAFAYGKGSELYDEQGKRYIDLGSGIAVNTFGAADDHWVQAVSRQAAQLAHASNYYHTKPMAELAQMLCERTGLSNVFFSNSGAEANECAIKAARKYASDRYGDARPTIITLEDSFHGRTLTTLSATGQAVFHQHFGPFTPGFRHVPANDLQAMEAALGAGDCCAVMMELVQGEGGVRVLDCDYVQAVADMAVARDVLLIIDEVQTGNGRTGTLFAYEQFGIAPDIVSTAKGLAGGLPMGATLFAERTKDVLGPGTHGSTFGGNPICAAAALSIISRLDEALLSGVMERRNLIESMLSDASGVVSITGMGLMVGIETEGAAVEIMKRCLARGVLVLTAKTKVRLLPPLNIPMPLLAEGLQVLREEIEATKQ